MTPQYLLTHGRLLIDNGFNILPIQPDTKSPNLPGWTQIKADHATLDRWLAEGKAGWGVGILGEHTPAIDLDITDGPTMQRMLDWCEVNVGAAPKRVGRPPRQMLICSTSSPFRKLKSRKYVSLDGETHQIEIIAGGAQFVAHAIHPDTRKPYTWLTDDLTTTVPDLLPTLNEGKARELIEFFESTVPEDWTPVQSAAGGKEPHIGNPNQTAEIKEIAAAAACIKNDDVDYDDWIRLAHAFKGATAGHEGDGNALFHEWSARSAKYDADTAEAAWDSITEVKAIGAGTIFHLAAQAGWVRPRASAAEDFGDIQKSDKPDSRLKFLTYAEMRMMPEPEWLVEGVVQKRSGALMFGKSNTFKSFLAIDIGLSVATGRPWHGHAVGTGKVLFVATEGANGVGRQRIPGWYDHHGVAEGDRDNALLFPKEISLDVKEQVDALVQSVRAWGDVALCVFDIFGGTMDGTETEDTTARAWVRSVQRIMRETGAATLTVAHTGWQDETRARMHTHFWGSFDSRMRVEGDKDKLTTCLTVERHKDADSSGSWGFAMKPTHDTLVPEFDESVKADKAAALPSSLRVAMAALDDAVQAHGILNMGEHWPDCKVVDMKIWREFCDNHELSSGEAEAKKKAFQRAKDGLLKRKCIDVFEGFAWSKFGV